MPTERETPDEETDLEPGLTAEHAELARSIAEQAPPLTKDQRARLRRLFGTSAGRSALARPTDTRPATRRNR